MSVARSAPATRPSAFLRSGDSVAPSPDPVRAGTVGFDRRGSTVMRTGGADGWQRAPISRRQTTTPGHEQSARARIHLTTGSLSAAGEPLQELDPVRDPRWRDLVARSRHSSVFHTPEWLTALQRTYGYQPVAFTNATEGQAVANGMVFCRVDSAVTGQRYVSLPFSDHCEPLVDEPSRLCSLLESLKALGNRERRYVDIKPIRPIDPPSGYALTQQFQWHRIDLSSDLETIFRAFHPSHTRRAVRKAERMRVTIDSGRSEQSLQDFYALHRMTRKRHGVPVQPLRWFQNLADAFGSQLQIYRATFAGRAIASILTLEHKKTLVYKYGCSDRTFNRLGAIPALFWRAIVDAKSAGCVEVDLGRSDSDHYGLIAFKEHLGGRPETLSYYRHTGDAPDFRVPGWLATLQRAVTYAPESIKLRAGNVFYKHFG